ncbi:hypothetical protein G4H13_02125 [Streptomyces rapamycinicus]|uniref:PLP-dependent transferase n=1 Tax=Streptomyces rhizosphaericus TaxID=114699 RepID=A0A6G4A7Q5_9ACTN|nr:hypothetical protein [Streptomyces rhizosphaericus]
MTFVDLTDLTSLDAAFRPTTRAVFFEVFTNPLLDVLDIETIVAITHDHDALAVVDNTFATPVLIRPLELGADIVIHSATKYLAGHGRVLAGALAGGGPAMDAIAVMRRRLGTITTPHNAAAVIEGMSTLELRVDRASATADGWPPLRRDALVRTAQAGAQGRSLRRFHAIHQGHQPR